MNQNTVKSSYQVSTFLRLFAMASSQHQSNQLLMAASHVLRKHRHVLFLTSNSWEPLELSRSSLWSPVLNVLPQRFNSPLKGVTFTEREVRLAAGSKCTLLKGIFQFENRQVQGCTRNAENDLTLVFQCYLRAIFNSDHLYYYLPLVTVR